MTIRNAAARSAATRNAAATALIMALLAAPCGAVELVVMDANVPGLKSGDKVDGDKPLKLAAGQRATLISADGRTLKLKGPSEAPPAPAGAEQGGDVLNALKNLTASRASGGGALGVVRSGGGGDLPEPWLVDVTAAGHRCLSPGVATVLWRGEAGAAGDLEMWPADRSWRAKAPWPSESDRLGLPASLPLRDRQGYIVTVDGKTSAITVHVAPGYLANDVMRVAWMLEMGCNAQAAALLRQVGS